MMDSCFVDIVTEFLGVAFHSILYYTNVYPKSIFEMRRKYSIVVYQSKHPEVNQYIDMCLKSIAECLKSGQLSRVEFVVTNEIYEPIIRFVFDIEKNNYYDDTADAYLVQAEQNLRAFCLNLSSMTHRFKDLPEDCSFTIYFHTTESTAVALATNPALEEFPLIETQQKFEESNKVLPLRRFPIRSYYLDAYVELK